MKRIIILLSSLVFLIPTNATAFRYNDVKDLSINFSSSSWVVLQKDASNSFDNYQKLYEYGFTKDNIDKIWKQDVYLYACKVNSLENNDFIELAIGIKQASLNKNLHTFSDSEIDDFGEIAKNKLGADNYEIVKVNNYKFIKVNYIDANSKYNIVDYYTYINGYGYTIKFQKPKAFTADELQEFMDIINSVEFKIDSNYENDSSNSLLSKFLIGSLSAAILGGISGIINKSKNRKSAERKIDSSKSIKFKEKEDKVKIEAEKREFVNDLSKNNQKKNDIDEENVEKEIKKIDTKNHSKENSKLYCSSCGAEIKESDKYCPECGESFDEDESNNKEKESISIDQKYDDLIKLKELYDKKIITKEEFEKEKKKIL